MQLHHPEMYKVRLEYTTQRLKAMTLPLRDQELIILRAAWLCQAPFSWGEHVAMGKRAGVTPEEIERLALDSLSPDWNERDGAIVQACDDLHYDAMVSDDTWVKLEKYLDEKQLLEVLMVNGIYHENAYMYSSLRAIFSAGNPGLVAR